MLSAKTCVPTSFVIALFLGGASIARATLVYEFDDVSGTPTTSFFATIGGTVDVRVYLKETATTILADEELFGASVRVTFNTPSNVASVQNVSDILPNVAFTDLTPPPSISSNDAGFTGSVDLDPFLTVDGMDRIFLGTFRFTGVSVGTVSLSALDRDTMSDDTVTGLETVLDGSINPGSATLTVTAIPEPPAWAMVTGVALMCAVWARRFS